MSWRFTGSPSHTLGVELETGVVSCATGELQGAAARIIAAVGPGSFGVDPAHIKHEMFESTLEITTGICPTPTAVHQDMTAALAALEPALRAGDLALIAAGSHPFSPWQLQSVTPDDRYAQILEKFRWPVQLVTTYGLHIHVGVPTGDHAIAVMNALTGLLPHFLALSASSPFRDGADTGYASARTMLWQSVPSSGLPPRLQDWSDYEGMADALVGGATIRTSRDLWWDVRPSPLLGTVELRICDSVPTIAEMCALAALAQAVVAEVCERLDHGHWPTRDPDWLVRENKWRASRHGIGAGMVHVDGTVAPLVEEVRELVERVRPYAQGLGGESELSGVLAILDQLPSYARQRELVERGGSLHDVVDLLARELATGRVGGWSRSGADR